MAIDRYQRQILLPQIGEVGQKKLAAASVLIIGCGALGSTIAEQLARAGVGKIRIVDRDIVELTNLQRQVLFDERDAKEGLPKAIAAANRLRQINSSNVIEPHIVDVDAGNIEKLCAGIDVILDGTDNIGTRYLINDVSVKLNIPWIYGACVGTEGRMMTIRPAIGACLRCIFPESPNPAELATCDTAGVLGPLAAVVGAMQAIAAIKLLTQHADAIGEELLTFDLWSNRIRSVSTIDAKRADCAVCGKRKFDFLQRRDRDVTARLCGQNAIQLQSMGITMREAGDRLRKVGTVQAYPFMIRCVLDEGGMSLTIFEDGRVIVQGTTDAARARSVVARYIGA